MSWAEWFVWIMIVPLVWLCYLWLTQPMFEDGYYVPFLVRVRKVLVRFFSP